MSSARGIDRRALLGDEGRNTRSPVMILLTRRLAVLGLLTPALAACGGQTAGGQNAASSGPVPDDMSLGNPAAKVTVVEYASVACPVCGRWYKEVWPAFKAKYIDTGKVHYTFREMLVGDGSEVAIAASGFLLARCAGKDRYFQVVDAVFKSQPDPNGGPRTQPSLYDDPKGVLSGIAKTFGLSDQQFNACITDSTALNALQTRVAANAKNGQVDSTPTFVINGKALDPGYQPLTALDAAIAQAS
jgi:protein-disulfide isomerase